MGRFYYNTNGFGFHRLDDAVRVLADLGYDGVALTPDVHHLDPLHATAAQVASFGSLCEALGLGVVVETGARFVLDPRRKHRPSLLDDAAGAALRLEFLTRCVDLARDLHAPVVSVWSGRAPEEVPPEVLAERLADGLARLGDHAAERGVRIGLEPEPGMWVERTEQGAAWLARLAHPALGLTLDVGHVLANREGDPAQHVAAHAGDLLVLQLDDHRAGVHDHLAFGEGEVDFRGLAAAVRASGFGGPLEVELSRHSAHAPAVAEASLAFLRRAFDG